MIQESAKRFRLLGIILRATAVFGLVLVAFLVVVGWLFDRHMIEKTLTLLALPPGLLMLVMLFGTAVAWSAGHQVATRLGLLYVVLYAASSNSLTADLIAHPLEYQFARVTPDSAPPFAAIVVLGGGVSVDESGYAWLAGSGDRLALAARMYHCGKASHLIATGSTYEWSGSMSYADATRQVWMDLGVPESAITTVEGLNTSLEMRNLRTLFDANELPFDTDGRIGLLTSATHLPRAQRLSRAQNFDFHPIAADFQTPINHRWPMAIIPNANAIHVISLASKEYLARLVRR